MMGFYILKLHHIRMTDIETMSDSGRGKQCKKMTTAWVENCCEGSNSLLSNKQEYLIDLTYNQQDLYSREGVA